MDATAGLSTSLRTCIRHMISFCQSKVVLDMLNRCIWAVLDNTTRSNSRFAVALHPSFEPFG